LSVISRDPLTGRDVVALPEAQTRLTAGDRLVVIGAFENIAQFMAALVTAPPRDPTD
jgi:Trk K+ transport system NAD-binding subunit